MPLVIVALTGQGAPIRQLQIALCPLQRLDRRFFVDAKDNGFGRRIDIEANNVGGLGCKLWIIALAPGFATRQIDLVSSAGIAKHTERQRRPAPRPKAVRSIAQIPPAEACPADARTRFPVAFV